MIGRSFLRVGRYFYPSKIMKHQKGRTQKDSYVDKLCIAYSTASSIPSSKVSSDADKDLNVFLQKYLNSVNRLCYSSNSNFGGHIVEEYFKYAYRQEDIEIVKLMSDRHKNRKGPDKKSNPLIVIPGSPGSGKSTFLSHFPDSNAFYEYTKSSSSVLVSTLTFNNGMNAGGPQLGLRIIYGLLRAMQLLNPTSKIFAWKAFQEFYMDYYHLSGDEAIEMIQNSVKSPSDIRILILIDELAKSDPPESNGEVSSELMKKIGHMLDEYGNVDIIVSALSPRFIDERVTPSGREIQYIVPKPLLESRLGSSECINWSNRMVEKAKVCIKNDINKNIDDTKVKIMSNIYILMSGHPRSLEKLCIYLEQEESDDWDTIICLLTDPNISYGTFLRELMRLLNSRIISLQGISLDYTSIFDISTFIFSTEEIGVYNVAYRGLLEKNRIMLFKKKGPSEFIFMCQSITSLNWLYRNGDYKFSLIGAILSQIILSKDKYLSLSFRKIGDILMNSLLNMSQRGLLLMAGPFLDNKYTIQKMNQVMLLSSRFSILTLSKIWEYIIAITITCHSYHYQLSSSILGFPRLIVSFPYKPKLHVKYDEEIYFNSNDVSNPLIESNTLYMPVKAQSGFDIRLVMNDNTLSNHQHMHVYLQCKIAMSPKNSLEDIIVNTVYHSIKHYFQVCKQTNLDNIHTGIYIYSTSSTTESHDHTLNKELILKKMKDRCKSENKDAITFISKNIKNNFKNIHILYKEEIHKWLLPSFLSIPELLSVVENDTVP